MKPNAIILAAALALICPAPAAYATEELAQKGAFTCDFELVLDPSVPPDQVAGVIDHDRQLMSSAEAAEGFKHKVIPIFIDPATGRAFSGGRYLFDTWAQARSYEKFVKEDFLTFDPGTGQVVPFLSRSIFADPHCFSWQVIGAAEVSDFRTTQYQLRTERWSVSDVNGIRGFLQSRWPEVKAAALQIPGVTAVWLLVNREEELVSVVYFQNRLGPNPGDGMGALMSAPSVLGADAAQNGWSLASWRATSP
jgi:hypothetical protein